MDRRSRQRWIGVALIAAGLGVILLRAPEPPTPRLLLNEVLFLPAEERPAFAEIVNAGSQDAVLNGVTLRGNQGRSFAMPPGMSLEAGAFVVVRFDGLTGQEGGVVHAPADDFLSGDTGAVWLTTADGTADGVAWGVNRPRAIELCRGGGKEDANANGVRDSDETSNFVKEDDDCGPPPLGGHVQLAYDSTLATDCIARMTIDSRFTLHPVIAPGAPDLVTVFRANEMAYDIATTGCSGAPGGNPIYTYPEGFHRSGTMPLTEDNLGYAAFFATLPEFGMQLPLPLFDPAANTLKGSYTGNGGGPWPAESFAPFEALSIYSNPSNCTDPGSGLYARPDQLEFCKDPTPCAVSATAPLECLGEPQRYYVLPFNKSFRWSGDSTKHLISDVTVTIDICNGCDAR
jgi:hypothetical protein